MVLESIIAVVGLFPKNKGVIVVTLSIKSCSMFTYASLCYSAHSHIEGASLYAASANLAEYVIFCSPGLSVS